MHIPDPLRAGDRISCIGITSRLPQEQFDPELHLRLPWLNRKGGHPSTGLNKASVAKVAFRHSLVVEAGQDYALQVAAEHRSKFITARDFQALTAITNAYTRKLLLEQKRSGNRKS